MGLVPEILEFVSLNKCEVVSHIKGVSNLVVIFILRERERERKSEREKWGRPTDKQKKGLSLKDRKTEGKRFDTIIDIYYLHL